MKLRTTLAAASVSAVPALGGLAITTPATAAPAPQGPVLVQLAPRPNCLAKPLFDRSGPGLKNWRAYDPYCTDNMTPGKWFGPWRYTKSGAFLDAERHNAKLY